MRTFLFILLNIFTWSALAENPKVAIIIDDIGYRATDSGVFGLPGNITLSVLPHTPYGKSLAEKARLSNLEVMLHIPMEAENGKFLGPGGLTKDMTKHAIQKNLSAAFDEIPFAVGINNHMGSLLTQMESPMTWVMEYLKKRDVIFIDSVTSNQSKAESIAKKYGVPSLHRHIFLDNNLDHKYIAKQFASLIKTAKKNKIAVAIAHPHPKTIASLKRLIPLLTEQNISLVSASELLNANKLPTVLVSQTK